MTDRGDDGQRTAVPQTSRFGAEQTQEYRYFAVVSIRVPGRVGVERVPISVDSPRPLTLAELRAAMGRDALDGLLTFSVLSSVGPTEGATVVGVTVVTAERR